MSVTPHGRLDNWIEGWRQFISVEADVPPEEAEFGQLFNVLILVSAAICLALSLIFWRAGQMRYFSRSTDAVIAAVFPLLFLPGSVAAFFLVKQGQIRPVARVYIWSMYAALLLATALFGGFRSPAWFLLLWPIILVGTLFEPKQALYMTVGAVGVYGLLLLAELLGWYQPAIEISARNFRFLGSAYAMIMLIVIGGGMASFVSVRWQRELIQAQTAITALRQERADLERAVAERTSRIESRAEQFRAIAELERAAVAIRNLEQLLEHTVTLISERLGFYHVGIFLIDPTGEWAVLRAASSQGGRRMLQRGHRLRVGQQGIVGYVSGTGLSRFAFNVGEDAVWFNNPDLPATKSEIALPLVVSGHRLGVLDIQTQQTAAFDSEDEEVLRTLADGVAIAIRNAQLLEETNSTLVRLERYQEADAIRAWRRALARRNLEVGYLYASGIVKEATHAAEDLPPTEMAGGLSLHTMIGEGLLKEREVNTVTTQMTEDGRYRLLVPISVSGQRVGMLVFERSSKWTEDMLQLVEAVVAQLDLALNNARLLEESRLRASQEAARGEIVGRVRALASTDAILRSAAEELGRALGVERSRIQLVHRD